MTSIAAPALLDLTLDNKEYGPGYSTIKHSTRRLSVSKTDEHRDLLLWMAQTGYDLNFPTCGRRPDADVPGFEDKFHIQFSCLSNHEQEILSTNQPETSANSLNSSNDSVQIISRSIEEMSFGGANAHVRLRTIATLGGLSSKIVKLRIDTPQNIATEGCGAGPSRFENLEGFTFHGHLSHFTTTFGYSWSTSFPNLTNLRIEGRCCWGDIRTVLRNCKNLVASMISIIADGRDDFEQTTVTHQHLKELTLVLSVSEPPAHVFDVPKLSQLHLWFTPTVAHSLKLSALLSKFIVTETCSVNLNFRSTTKLPTGFELTEK